MDNIDILILALISLVVFVAGVVQLKWTPKKINWICGYRTRRSSKSQQAWDYSNKLCGKFLCWIGLILLLMNLSLIVLNIFGTSFSNDENLVSYLNGGVVIFGFLITYMIIEYNLSKKFKD